MRLGRIILASLTALCAYSYAQTALKPSHAHESLRFLQVVVPMLVHAADATIEAPATPTAHHAVFEFTALTATPLGGAIFLLASLIAIDLSTRRHTRALLRL